VRGECELHLAKTNENIAGSHPAKMRSKLIFSELYFGGKKQIQNFSDRLLLKKRGLKTETQEGKYGYS